MPGPLVIPAIAAAARVGQAALPYAARMGNSMTPYMRYMMELAKRQFNAPAVTAGRTMAAGGRGGVPGMPTTAGGVAGPGTGLATRAGTGMVPGGAGGGGVGSYTMPGGLVNQLAGYGLAGAGAGAIVASGASSPAQIQAGLNPPPEAAAEIPEGNTLNSPKARSEMGLPPVEIGPQGAVGPAGEFGEDPGIIPMSPMETSAGPIPGAVGGPVPQQSPVFQTVATGGPERYMAPVAAPKKRKAKKAAPKFKAPTKKEVLAAAVEQQAQVQAVQQKAAQDAYYNSRLNPLGGTSEYADLQRGHLNR